MSKNYVYNGWRPDGPAEMMGIDHYADEASDNPLEDVATQDCAEIIQLTPETAVLVVDGNRRNDAVHLVRADLYFTNYGWPGYEWPDDARREIERNARNIKSLWLKAGATEEEAQKEADAFRSDPSSLFDGCETDLEETSSQMTLEIEAREQAEEMARRKTPDRIKPETYSTDVIKDLMDDGT